MSNHEIRYEVHTLQQTGRCRDCYRNCRISRASVLNTVNGKTWRESTFNIIRKSRPRRRTLKVQENWKSANHNHGTVITKVKKKITNTEIPTRMLLAKPLKTSELFREKELDNKFPAKTGRRSKQRLSNVFFMQAEGPASEIQGKRNILSPSDWLPLVKSIVAGQDPVVLQELSGKPIDEKESLLTARYWGSGTCNNGGHFRGFRIGQIISSSKSKVDCCWISHFCILSNSLLTKCCRRARSKQRMSGNKMSRMFVLIFRFCKIQRRRA